MEIITKADLQALFSGDGNLMRKFYDQDRNAIWINRRKLAESAVLNYLHSDYKIIFDACEFEESFKFNVSLKVQ